MGNGNEGFWLNLGGEAWPGVSVASRGSDSLEVLLVDRNTSDVRRKSALGTAWKAGWENLGHPAVLHPLNSPVAISRGRDLLDVFVVSLAGEVLRKQLDGKIWSDWVSLGVPPGGAMSRPAVCSFLSQNNVAIVVRGGQNLVYAKFLLGSKTGEAWQNLGNLDGQSGAIFNPVAVWRGAYFVDVFALSEDYQLFHKGYQWGGWSPKGSWEPLGGVFVEEDIAATSWAPDRLDVFGIGYGEKSSTPGLLHKSWSGAQWSSWEQLAGAGVTYLRAVSRGPGRLDLVARGGSITDPTAVYHRSLVNGVWNPAPEADWENISGNFYVGHPPALVSWGPERLDVFMVGEPAVDRDDDVWTRWWNGAVWKPQP